jgi:site-specific recombinase XerD
LWAELKQLPSSDKTEAVFLSRFGNRLDRHAIHRLIKKAVEKAGINPHTSAHWLRHAHACHSLNNGAGIDLLMKSLGHSSLALYQFAFKSVILVRYLTGMSDVRENMPRVSRVLPHQESGAGATKD